MAFVRYMTMLTITTFAVAAGSFFCTTDGTGLRVIMTLLRIFVDINFSCVDVLSLIIDVRHVMYFHIIKICLVIFVISIGETQL